MLDNVPPDIFEQYEGRKPEKGALLKHPEIPSERKAESPVEIRPLAKEPGGEREAAFAEIEKNQEEAEKGKGAGFSEEQKKAANVRVENLVRIAQTKGKQAALEEAGNDDQYTLDLLHARLVEEERGSRPE